VGVRDFLKPWNERGASGVAGLTKDADDDQTRCHQVSFSVSFYSIFLLEHVLRVPVPERVSDDDLLLACILLLVTV
jgi:hypothetical protein